MTNNNIIDIRAHAPIENKKKYKKAEDFIGWKSPDGKLEVIGTAGKDKRGIALFKVTCTECSKDKELFPDGYFVITKGNLTKGVKPCSCSKSPKWKDWQYLLLARREGEKKDFIVHGFAGEFKNAHTKLNLECLKDGYKWTARAASIINDGSGCPKCKYELQSGQLKTPEYFALQKCIDICKEMNYDVVGFINGYKGAHKTHFEYICKIHGKQNANYHNFVNGGTRCMGCWRDTGIFYGYYPERKDEVDLLYILNFNAKFIKVGRSFDVERRIPELQRESGIQEIIKLRIFTATHQEIYDLEQELHSELRERNFQHYLDWSTECFQNDSLHILNKMLDEYGLEEVKL